MIAAESGPARVAPGRTGVLALSLRHPAAALATSLALVVAIAVADFLTGYEMRLAFLYFAPLVLSTWVVGRSAGILIAAIAATTWLLTFRSSHSYSSAFYYYWEGALTVGSYLVFVLLLSRLRQAQAEAILARHRDAGNRASRLVTLGELASAMAHELNQPLAAIATYNNACLRLIDSKDFDRAELRDAMGKCRDQARRAGDIVHRLREMVRRPGPVLAEQDLSEIARSALQLAESDAADAGVLVEFAPSAEALPVLADEILIEQVLLNILRNAFDATQGLDAARRRVTVSTAPAGNGAANVKVADCGRGVNEEIQPRLFDAFVTTKPAGLGFGLSICRSIVEAHGGVIRFAPNAEGGSVFEFTLPGKR